MASRAFLAAMFIIVVIAVIAVFAPPAAAARKIVGGNSGGWKNSGDYQHSAGMLHLHGDEILDDDAVAAKGLNVGMRTITLQNPDCDLDNCVKDSDCRSEDGCRCDNEEVGPPYPTYECFFVPSN